MKMSSCQVAIIGAGPYGLAATAHLRSAGVETLSFGQVMDFWQKHMPAGMLLRSPWDASHIADPNNAFTLDQYEKSRSIRLSRPVPLEDFVQYGVWFQRQVIPDLDTRRVECLEQTADGFQLVMTDGDIISSRRVVIAAGIARFARRPPVFDGMSRKLVSHSSEHAGFRDFAHRSVVIIGGGQSAIESAALLHEAGAQVELLLRSPAIRWLRRSALFHNKFNPLRRVLYHRSDVGPAFVSHLVSRPEWFRRLSPAMQQTVAQRSIRPAGAAWLVDRVRPVKITTDRHVLSATASADQICITLDDGSRRSVDHILLGTGYSVDISRYEFLSPKIIHGLCHIQGYPELSRNFESSIPGLHFVGAPAARSFGPLMRFVSGTGFAGRALTAALAQKSAAQYSREKIPWVRVAKSQSG